VPADPELSGADPAPAESAPPVAPSPGIDAGASAITLREGTAALVAPGSSEGAPVLPEPARAAAPPASPPLTIDEEAPALGIEAILPTLSADDPAASPAPRASRTKRPKRSAARARGPLPRSIDETDPYLE
jgi:hypothetical protein